MIIPSKTILLGIVRFPHFFEIKTDDFMRQIYTTAWTFVYLNDEIGWPDYTGLA